MKTKLISAIVGVASLAIVITLGFCLVKSKHNSANIYITSEREKLRAGHEFGYISGSGRFDHHNEGPDGISSLRVKTTLLPNLNENNNFYSLGYQYSVQLQPQEMKDAFGRGNSKIVAYCLDFNFYLLDKDGFCLMEIDTKEAEKRYSPMRSHFIYVGEEAGLFHQTPGSHGEQVFLTWIEIPEHIARRTTKIVYWPLFQAAMFTVDPEEVD